MSDVQAYLQCCEREVAGSLLMYPDLWDEVPRLDPEAFLHKPSKWTYSRLCALASDSRPWSLGLVLDGIPVQKRQPVLDLLESAIDSRASVKVSAEAVAEAWLVRKVQAAGARMTKDWTPGARAADLLAPTEETLAALSQGSSRTEAQPVLLAMQELILAVKEGRLRGGTKTGLPTFDRLVGGLYPSKLYVVGARPSCGKTALSVTLNLAAARDGASVLAVTTETVRIDYAGRLMSNAGNVDAWEIRNGRVENAELREIVQCVPTAVSIVDGAATIDQIRTEVHRWRRAHGGRCVVTVDYLEEIRSPAKGSREQEVAHLITSLHEIAKADDVAMVVFSQLNRPPKQQSRQERDEGPTKEALRYSGMIEQAADLVMLLYLDGERVENSLPQPIWIKVDKNKVSGRCYRCKGQVLPTASRVAETETSHD